MRRSQCCKVLQVLLWALCMCALCAMCCYVGGAVCGHRCDVVAVHGNGALSNYHCGIDLVLPAHSITVWAKQLEKAGNEATGQHARPCWWSALASIPSMRLDKDVVHHRMNCVPAGGDLIPRSRSAKAWNPQLSLSGNKIAVVVVTGFTVARALLTPKQSLYGVRVQVCTLHRLIVASALTCHPGAVSMETLKCFDSLYPNRLCSIHSEQLSGRAPT